MNRLKKLFIIALAFVMAVSFVGCKKDSNLSKPDDTVIYPATGKYIVKDGVSDYEILVPKGDLDWSLTYAVEEIQYGFKKSCGYEMKSTDTVTQGKKYISVGKTDLYLENEEAISPTKPEDLQTRVVTYGDNVFCFAKSTNFTTFSVYRFLNLTLGWKAYACDDVYVDNLKDVKLYEINDTDKADMEIRRAATSRYYVRDNDYYNYEQYKRFTRMLLNNYTDNFFSGGHNVILQILPKDIYQEKHPEWYTQPNSVMKEGEELGQLCLTNEEMTEEFIKRVKEIILADDDFDRKSYFMIGMQDNYGKCMCSNCVELAKRNNANGEDITRAGNFIMFANKVSKAVNEWIKTIDPDKEIWFPIYAYYHNVNAPVRQLADGSYEPVNENVIPEKHVVIDFAPLKNDLTYAYTDDRNVQVNEQLKQWGALTNKIILYYYRVNYGLKILPINDIITVPQAIKDSVARGYVSVNTSDGASEGTCMNDLKMYVYSQMMWDSSKSTDALAYEFIDYWYKPIADEFKEYYNSLKAWQYRQTEELSPFPQCQDSSWQNAKFWPKGVIDGFVKQVKGMIEKLEPLKTSDPVAYKKYFDRVNCELIWHYYLYMQNYKKYFNESEKNEMKEFLIKYCYEYDCVQLGSVGTIDNAVNGW